MRLLLRIHRREFYVGTYLCSVKICGIGEKPGEGTAFRGLGTVMPQVRMAASTSTSWTRHARPAPVRQSTVDGGKECWIRDEQTDTAVPAAELL